LLAEGAVFGCCPVDLAEAPEGRRRVSRLRQGSQELVALISAAILVSLIDPSLGVRSQNEAALGEQSLGVLTFALGGIGAGAQKGFLTPADLEEGID
jgi:hypothetical protein